MLPSLRVSKFLYSRSLDVVGDASNINTRSILIRNRLDVKKFVNRSKSSFRSNFSSRCHSNQQSASKKPRSNMITSSFLAEVAKVSDNWLRAAHAVQTLNKGSNLFGMGQTLALSVRIFVRKLFLRRNMSKEPMQLDFPALGEPANSITIGLRGRDLRLISRTAAASFSSSIILLSSSALLISHHRSRADH